MNYENGMQIIYDVLKKGVLVDFRGQTHYLPGPFPSQREAIRAGESFCREQGWGPGQDTQRRG